MRIYSCHCYKEPYKIEIIIAHFADEDTKVYTICVCVCVCVCAVCSVMSNSL